MPSVWIVTVGEPPLNDVTSRLWRSGLIAQSLRESGWDVTFWLSSFDHFRKRQAYEEEGPTGGGQGADEIVLKAPSYRRNVSVARLVNHHQLARSFRRQAATLPAPDLMVVSFPPISLARAAMQFAEQRRVPAVLDVRDLWPDVFETAFPQRLRWVAHALLMPARVVTRRLLSNAENVMAVSESYLDWARAHGAPEDARTGAFPLTYTPGPIDPGATAAVRQLLSPLTYDKLVVFVGTFGQSYDLETVVASARAHDASDGGQRIGFVLCGDGDKAADLRRAAAGLNNVVFTGWLGASEVSALLLQADIGLLSYAAAAQQSIPNKFYEYLAHGTAVVSSLRETRTLVEGHVGEVYEAGDAQSLTAAIQRVVSNPAKLEEFKTRASEVFHHASVANGQRMYAFVVGATRR